MVCRVSGYSTVPPSFPVNNSRGALSPFRQRPVVLRYCLWGKGNYERGVVHQLISDWGWGEVVKTKTAAAVLIGDGVLPSLCSALTYPPAFSVVADSLFVGLC